MEQLVTIAVRFEQSEKPSETSRNPASLGLVWEAHRTVRPLPNAAAAAGS